MRRVSNMKKPLAPRDLIQVSCEACELVVFRTTASRVRSAPAGEHLAMLRAYESHKARSGRPCKAPPFEVVVQAAHANALPTPRGLTRRA